MIKTEYKSSIIYIRGKSQHFPLVFIIAFIGFILSTLQAFGESPDYSSYDYFFDTLRNSKLDALEESRFEPFFKITSLFLTEIIPNNLMVYGIYVGLALWLKSWLIIQYNSNVKFFLIVILFYFVRYFPLHELTQLRAACSISCALVSAKLIWEKKFFPGNIFLIISIMFHMSAVAIAPIIYLSIDSRTRVIAFSLIAFLIFSLISNFVANYLADYILILGAYQNQGYSDVKVNLLGVHLLIDWMMIIISLLIWDKLSVIMKRVVLIELIGMALFYSSFELGVVVHRVREFISVFWIFYLAEGFKYKNLRAYFYLYIVVCLIAYLYINFFGGLLFKLKF